MQAEKQKKRVHAIEQPDEHCDPLNDLGLDMVSFEKTAAFSVASHFGLSFISNIVWQSPVIWTLGEVPMWQWWSKSRVAE